MKILSSRQVGSFLSGRSLHETHVSSIAHIGCFLGLLAVFAVTRSTSLSTLNICRLDQLHYEYTECDSSGGRWRVPVPKEPGLCTVNCQSGMIPIRGKQCNFACSIGEYLDIQGDQECHSCPAGTYSLGGGVRFDEWDSLPSGFAVNTEKVVHNPWGRSVKHKGNCSRSEWKPMGDYVMSMPGRCPSNLLYSANLVRAGEVRFEYQYTDPETIFHFSVQNDQCQAMNSENNDKWPEITTEGKWATLVVTLKSGMNLLQWRTIGALSDIIHSSVSPILIRKVEITGIAYTSECTNCPNGTYSSGGTSFCGVCPPDSFSLHGASQCQPCKTTEYSEPGSSVCSLRPPCTEYDYYSFQSPCTEDAMTKITYRWIEPKICSDTAKNSVKLPTDGKPTKCLPCNPGMHRVNTSHCDFCEENQFADPNAKCRDCPASTSPKNEVNYMYWTVMPPNVTTKCIPVGLDDCSNSAGWVPMGTHVRSSFGPKDRNVFLVLILKLDGIRGQSGMLDGKPTTLARISFEMELNCQTSCQLIFLSDASGRNSVLQTWDTSVKKKVFSHRIFTNESLTFTWAFQPDDYGLVGHEDGEDPLAKMKNEVKIYNIKVTNTISGGASVCESCPEGKTAGGCIPCPDGKYVDPISQKCMPCPHGTVLPSSNSWGKESCQACGPGLHPVSGRSCKSDCHFTDDEGRKFDFSELDGVRFVSGTRLFTASGTQYYHGFNISLCNHGDEPLPTCINNVTVDTMSLGSKMAEVVSQRSMLQQPSVLSSMVCRSTLVPQGDPDKLVVSAQSVSLGSHLTKVVTNISLEDMYELEGFPSQDTERDIHFYYDSGSTTSACPDGRSTVISLRCDPDQKGKGQVNLSPKCSDGTCDGCNFHFLWLTRHACPKCRKEDYSVVRGECVDGEQAIHYFPPKYCLQLPEEALTPMSQKCSVLPFAVMVAIPVSLGVGLILILLLVYCWSRNKKLEYKYMKLIETAGGHDGELPAADTCGMEDDEEDVHFSSTHDSSSFFGKIKEKFSSSNRMKDADNPFVAMNLMEKMTST